MSLDLEGKTAVVTGSGQGIGRAVAHLLAAQGAAVIVNSRSAQSPDNTTTAADVTEEILASGGRARAVFADAGTMRGAGELIEAALESFGSVDILVNNAGVYPAARVEDMTEQTWDTVMNVNLKSTYATCHYAIPHMRSKGFGRVVNMISRAGLAGLASMTAYAASKAGVTGFTFALAKEVADAGITVNCVAPSAATERPERTAAERRARTGHTSFAAPSARTAEQIAPMVAYLVGDQGVGDQRPHLLCGGRAGVAL